MNKYIKPEIEIVYFDVEDIITASSGGSGDMIPEELSKAGLLVTQTTDDVLSSFNQ